MVNGRNKPSLVSHRMKNVNYRKKRYFHFPGAKIEVICRFSYPFNGSAYEILSVNGANFLLFCIIRLHLLSKQL